MYFDTKKDLEDITYAYDNVLDDRDFYKGELSDCHSELDDMQTELDDFEYQISDLEDNLSDCEYELDNYCE